MLNAHSAREWFLRQGGCVQPSAAVSIAQHFVALTTNVAAAQAFGITRCLKFWDWVGGAFRCGRPLACRLPLPLGRSSFATCWPGRTPWMRTFSMPPLGTICRCAWRCWTLVPQFLPFGQPLHRPLQPWLAALGSVFAATGDGEQRQARHPRRPVPDHAHGPHRLGRAGHQWPARLFSAAAPGAGCGARWNLLWPGAAANTWGRTSRAWSSTPLPRPRR